MLRNRTSVLYNICLCVQVVSDVCPVVSDSISIIRVRRYYGKIYGNEGWAALNVKYIVVKGFVQSFVGFQYLLPSERIYIFNIFFFFFSIILYFQRAMDFSINQDLTYSLLSVTN